MLAQPSAASVASVIARLPESSRAIVERHHAQDSERIARNRARFDQLQEAKAAKADAIKRRAYLEPFEARGKLYRDGPTTGYDAGGSQRERLPDPALNEVNAEIAKWEKRIAALQAESDPPAMTGGRLDALLAAIDPDASIAECRVNTKVGKNESDADALARMRRAIVAKREERETVTRKHRTLDEILAAARAQVHAVAVRSVPKVLGALEGGQVEMPKAKLPGAVGHHINFVPDGVGLVCWAFQTEITAKIEELIRANFDPANAMPASEKAATLEALDAELAGLRADEAALVEGIVAAGGNAFHFPDAPLEAVLGIKIS